MWIAMTLHCKVCAIKGQEQLNHYKNRWMGNKGEGNIIQEGATTGYRMLQ
jgi:hypothetical protein